MAPSINKPKLPSHFALFRIVKIIVENKNRRNPIRTIKPIENAPKTMRGINAPVMN
jgi:hypothetical protein